MSRSSGVAALSALAAVFVLSACGPDAPPSAAPVASTTAASPTSASPIPASSTENGIDQLSGKALLERAVTASKQAKSLRLKGKVVEGKDSFELDVTLSGETLARGTIGMGKEEIEFIRIDEKFYFRGNESFYSEPGEQTDPEVMKELTSNYILTSVDDTEMKGFVELAELAHIFDEFLPEGPALVKKGQQKVVNGRPALKVSDLVDTGAIWVATQGEPHILRIESGKDIRMDFLDFGKPVSAQPPKSSEVLELEQ